jgi:predicted porin
MKKSLIAAAALTAIAGAAQAQSSVEVYGVLDMSYSTVEANGGSTNGTIVNNKLTAVGNMDSANGSGILNGSRIGFRGTEDLGAGNKAGFVVEYGINLTNSQSDATGSYANSGTDQSGKAQLGQPLANMRQGYVSFTNANFGTLKAGTQYSFVDASGGELAGALASGGTNGSQGAHALFKYGQQGRLSNSITYATPVFSGFQAKFGVNKGEQVTTDAAPTKVGDATEYALEYKQGKLVAAYSYQKTKNFTGAATKVVSLLGTADSATIANTTQSDLTWAVYGANYDFGFAKVGLNHADYKNESQSNSTYNLKSAHNTASASVPVSANFTVGLGYTDGEIKVNGVKYYDTTGYDLVGVYTLSKRTNVYAAYMKSKFDAKTTTTGFGNNADQEQIGVGIRHSF